MRTPILLLGALLGLCSCSDDSPPHPRFENREMNRFDVIRERTPPNFPDLFVVRDKASGVDYLVLESSNSKGIAITRLDAAEHAMQVVSTNYFP